MIRHLREGFRLGDILITPEAARAVLENEADHYREI